MTTRVSFPLLLAFLLSGTLAASAASPPPNILFLLADDLGYGDLGCYGQKRIQTPNLDRLAAQGMRFTQVYAGSTVCAPSRSVLMEGKHTGHSRIRGNARHPLQPEDTTVAEVLKSQGYRTALIGKWGLGDAGTTGSPIRQGFDHFFGYFDQRHAHNYYPTHLWRNEAKVPLRNTVPKEDAVGAGVSDNRLDYSADRIADEALRWVRENRAGPFFLYFAVTLPHANNEAGAKGMEVPDYGPYAALDWPEPAKGHAAMITRLDRDVGRMLDLLRELGIDRQTIVFFTSDNGPHKEGGYHPEFNDSNGPLRGIKRDLYDGGIRVPMIVRWPGHVPAGKVSAAVWSFADFLPTAADLAGTRVPKGIDGVSVLPVLEGRRRDLKERFLYWEFHERGFQQAVRWGNWKAVRLGPAKPLELYQIAADPGEAHDVAAQHPKTVRRIESYLATARIESAGWPVTTRPER